MDHAEMMKQIVEARARSAHEFHNEVLRSPSMWGTHDVVKGTPFISKDAETIRTQEHAARERNER